MRINVVEAPRPTEPTTRHDFATATPARAATVAARQHGPECSKKTPEQRMRETILKDLGLTEEDLEAFSPERTKSVEARIAERIGNRLEIQARKKLEAISATRAALRNARGLSLARL